MPASPGAVDAHPANKPDVAMSYAEFLAPAPQAFAFDFTRYLVAALTISAIVWVMAHTRLASRRIQPRLASMADRKREFLLSLRSVVFFSLGTCLLFAGNRAGIFHFTRESFGWGRDLLLLLGMIFAHDAWFYWTHRAMHTRLLYKPFHLAHHRSVTPTPWAIYSFSLPEATTNFLFAVVWQFCFSTPQHIMVSWMLFQVARNGMGHAGFELMPRWWLASPLTSWINTTTHHDLHHSGGFGTNFGLYFTFWDRLMGTEHPAYAETFNRVTAPSGARARAELTPSEA